MSVRPSKVLLAVDGSDESLAVVQYACKMLPPFSSEVTVFHVMSTVPEVFWDLGNDPEWLEKVEAVRAFQQKQEDSIRNFVNKCLECFNSAGFASDRVATKIGRQQNGIARDIVAEAKNGYDVLIIGRGKTGSIKDMPLGSVASKILSAVPDLAVWLVGTVKASDNKILIALDSSENSQQAIKHVGKMCLSSDSTITLFHAVRGISISIEGMEDIFPNSYRQQLLEDAQQEINSALKLARLLLTKSDISPERITTRIVTGVQSRAGAILEEAGAGGYGTIVIGRRGVSQVMEFSMGRVTNKLIQTAKEHALWIVG